MLYGSLDAAREQLLIVIPRWNSYKNLSRPVKIFRILQELTAVVHKIPGSDIQDSEDATDWGIRMGKENIEDLPEALPFLSKTHYYDYVTEITHLIRDICQNKSGHTRILEILEQYTKSKHLSTVGQFATNEMIDHYTYLSKMGDAVDHKDIRMILKGYSAVCEVYCKQMVLFTCLIKLRDTGKHEASMELAKPRTEYEHNIKFVHGKIPLLTHPYNFDVSTSSRHIEAELDVSTRSIIFYGKNPNDQKTISYESFVNNSKELASLVLACLLLPIIFSAYDWLTLEFLLKPGSQETHPNSSAQIPPWLPL